MHQWLLHRLSPLPMDLLSFWDHVQPQVTTHFSPDVFSSVWGLCFSLHCISHPLATLHSSAPFYLLCIYPSLRILYFSTCYTLPRGYLCLICTMVFLHFVFLFLNSQWQEVLTQFVCFCTYSFNLMLCTMCSYLPPLQHSSNLFPFVIVFL